MANQHILQVSELTKKVRFILESELNSVWLCGEISNFVAASSGHWYLSLKDAKSQVRCAMFRGNNRRVRLSPRNGQQVLVRAKVSLYEPRGDFQLIIEQMEDAGEGLLRQQFDQLKTRLNAEGLFALEDKKPLPEPIGRVGVITSATGAAIKDILTVLHRRNPSIAVIIYPVLVQGELAADEISAAIKLANNRHECDVLILGRGGGSLEDLWSFNEEKVVRAIYASQLPIVSAVGHEIDTTLSDYAADLRAATPSAAAELVSVDTSEIANNIKKLKQRLSLASQKHLTLYQKELAVFSHRLAQVHPQQQLEVQQQKADELSIRLKRAIDYRMQMVRQRPVRLEQQLLHLSPSRKIQLAQADIQQHKDRLCHAIANMYRQKGQKFAHQLEALNIVSPLATIARGYNIARNKQGKIIRTCAQVAVGDAISLQLTDGTITAQVTKTEMK